MGLEIVKVQRPIIPPDGDFLVYAEGKSRLEAKPFTPQLRALLGNSLKGYFEAEHGPKGWTLGKRVQDRAW